MKLSVVEVSDGRTYDASTISAILKPTAGGNTEVLKFSFHDRFCRKVVGARSNDSAQPFHLAGEKETS